MPTPRACSSSRSPPARCRPARRSQRTKTLAQLYFRAGNYGKAIQYANQYLKSVPGRPGHAAAWSRRRYYQQKDYKGAIAAAERIIKGGQRPSEDVLQLLLRSSYEINDKAGTAQALELLLKYYPSPDTWERVLDGYIAQTKHDHELLALYRLAEDVGALTQAAPVHGHDAGAGRRAASRSRASAIIEKGIAAGVFQGEEPARAQRTLDSAKRRADVERAGAAEGRGGSWRRRRPATRCMRSASSTSAPATTPRRSDALAKALAKGGLSDVDAANDAARHRAVARRARRPRPTRRSTPIKDPKFAEVAQALDDQGDADRTVAPRAGRQNEKAPGREAGGFVLCRPATAGPSARQPAAGAAPGPGRLRVDVQHPEPGDLGVLRRP